MLQETRLVQEVTWLVKQLGVDEDKEEANQTQHSLAKLNKAFWLLLKVRVSQMTLSVYFDD